MVCSVPSSVLTTAVLAPASSFVIVPWIADTTSSVARTGNTINPATTATATNAFIANLIGCILLDSLWSTRFDTQRLTHVLRLNNRNVACLLRAAIAELHSSCVSPNQRNTSQILSHSDRVGPAELRRFIMSEATHNDRSAQSSRPKSAAATEADDGARNSNDRASL